MTKLKQTSQQWRTDFRDGGFAEKCRMLSFLCLCLFMLDCSIFGGGHYLVIGSFTPRMILGFAALALAIPAFFKDFRFHLRNPLLWFTAAFLIYLAICAVRGYLAQNHMGVLISDIKGFFWLFLIPVYLITVKRKRELSILLDVIVLGAGIQALYVLVVNIICVTVPNGIMIFYDWMLHSSQMGFVNIISSTLFRIFMKSCPFMVFACAITLFRQIRAKKIDVYGLVVQILCMNALLLSFTRSVYGCLAIVLIAVVAVVVIFYRQHTKRILAVLCLSIVLLVGFVATQEIALGGNYINYAISRTFGTKPTISPLVKLHNIIFYGDPSYSRPGQTMPDDQELNDQQAALDQTDVSDNLRAQTAAELKELFIQSPVIGNGLGAVSPTRNGPDEYFYLDVLARMGIVGLILYILPFAYIVLWLLRRRAQIEEPFRAWAAVCGLIGFWAITWFNPWMNAVLGISAYALCASITNLKINKFHDTEATK